MEKQTVREVVTIRFPDPVAEADIVGKHTEACHVDTCHKLQLVTVRDHGAQNRGMHFFQYLITNELCRKCGHMRPRSKSI